MIGPYWMGADGSDEMVHYGHCTLAHVATRLVGAKLQSRVKPLAIALILTTRIDGRNCQRCAFSNWFGLPRYETKRTALIWGFASFTSVFTPNNAYKSQSALLWHDFGFQHLRFQHRRAVYINSASCFLSKTVTFMSMCNNEVSFCGHVVQFVRIAERHRPKIRYNVPVQIWIRIQCCILL